MHLYRVTNIIQMLSILMSFLIAQVASLLISEIMYDPDPAVGLPVFEYVEWVNVGGDTVDITGWQWVAGDKVRVVTGGKLYPGGRIIVCSPSGAPFFTAFGPVLAMESFPALRNTGDRLSLVSPEGITVNSVEYSPDQFPDVLKSNGGWSLELTDLVNYCNAAAWMPSVDPSGGTPGRENSQYFNLPESETPMLIRAAGYDDHLFVLLFSGTLYPALDMNNYTCIVSPGSMRAIPSRAPVYGFPGLFFFFPENQDRNLAYTIELSGTVTSCTGSNAQLRQVPLGFPVQPETGDVVITEIMFDPRVDQPEFVEVFNRSERVIDLRNCILARANAAGSIISFSDQQAISYWLFPRCFAVITTSAATFLKAWPFTDPAAAVERSDMPSLTNVESQLILMDRNQKRLDVVTYSPDWHYPYLDETKGVSLERIDFNASGTDRSNWFSASSSSGYSTPGSLNSTLINAGESKGEFFTLESTIGYATDPLSAVRVTVSYRFESAGWFLRMNVFNCRGMPVKTIYPFGMAAMEGEVGWDGLDSAQQLVPDGIYLIVADYYHPTGKKGRWKKACAIIRDY